jgi:outer membrane protein assembly factor BamB
MSPRALSWSRIAVLISCTALLAMPFLGAGPLLVRDPAGGFPAPSGHNPSINTATTASQLPPSHSAISGLWKAFRYNSSHESRSPLPGPDRPALMWQSKSGGGVSSAIQAADGTLIVGTRTGDVVGFGPTGATLWRFSIPKFGAAMISSVSSDGHGNVLVGSQIGTLYDIRPEGGSFASQVIWTAVTGGPIFSSPVVGPSGTIYVGSNDGNLYAIGKAGITSWTYLTGGAVQSSPAVAPSGEVYVGSNDGNVYAIYPNGSLQWKYNTTATVFSSPAIGPDGTIYVGSSNGIVYALAPNGTLDWEFGTGGPVLASPALGANGTVYIGSQDSNLYAIEPNGSEQWAFHTNGSIFSSAAVDSRGTIFFGNDGYNVYALFPNGSLEWKYDAGGRVKSSPIVGPDGSLYFTTVGHYAVALGTPKVVFTEGGLPAGHQWQLIVNGTNYSTNKSSITVHPGLSGVFSWSAPTILCGNGCRFEGSSGSVDTFTDHQVLVSFSEEFKIVLHVDPQGKGSTSPMANKTSWIAAFSDQQISVNPSLLYTFVNWTSSSGNLTIANPNSTRTQVHVAGTGVIIAHLQVIIGAPWRMSSVVAGSPVVHSNAALGLLTRAEGPCRHR